MTTRRSLLLGLGGALALAEAVCPARAAPPAVLDWRGPHQAGIATPPTPFAIFAAFDLLAQDRADLREALRLLSDEIATQTVPGPIPQGDDPLMPPPDNGLLGEGRAGQRLSVTVSLGASVFDDRFGLAARRPRELTAMERFPNDAIDPDLAHGDLMLQISADTREAVLHALRAIVRRTGRVLVPRWQIEGFLPARPAAPAEATPRNMLGFKDGTSNIDRDDAAAMDRLVWVPPGSEPAWTAGGSYQVVRLIRNLVERWDRTQLAAQEAIMGRHRLSGAPLGKTEEHDTPDMALLPDKAHIRLANPRQPESAANLILRRGYNYARGLDRAGRMDMGLIFVSYQASLDAGFRAVQARLNGEPLEEYVKPFGGGYFFALPGLGSQDHLGQTLLD
ncbi:Dyp-type peroxidase [bacterium]|nr:Dyp-type peroxidase [bacterium]